MRSGLPPEEPGLRRTTRLSLPDAARVLRSRELLAATLAGSLLFFAFQGAFSYIGFRLEREPFSLSDGATGLVFLVWAIGAIGPTAGRIADRRGWSIVALAGLATAAAGIGLSLAHVLPLILLGLALVTLGNFGGITAAQLGVASSTESDRGLASALYFSSYYVAGALGAWAPGLAWQAWGWDGVAVLCLGAYAVGASALLLARRAGARRRLNARPDGSPTTRPSSAIVRPRSSVRTTRPRSVRPANGLSLWRSSSVSRGDRPRPARGRRARRRRRRPPRASPLARPKRRAGPDPSSSASRAGGDARVPQQREQRLGARDPAPDREVVVARLQRGRRRRVVAADQREVAEPLPQRRRGRPRRAAAARTSRPRRAARRRPRRARGSAGRSRTSRRPRAPAPPRPARRRDRSRRGRRGARSRSPPRAGSRGRSPRARRRRGASAR